MQYVLLFVVVFAVLLLVSMLRIVPEYPGWWFTDGVSRKRQAGFRQ